MTSALAADPFQPRPFDWPQWQGPDRTAVSRETKLLKEWTKEGPPLAWQIRGLGAGYSTPTASCSGEKTCARTSAAVPAAGATANRPSCDGVKATEVYFNKQMQNHHGGLVLIDGYLYGEGSGQLACIEFKTGKEMWRERKAGKGSIAAADGRLYYRNEGGPIVLVDVNPEQYIERGRFTPSQRSGAPSWPHPVIANGKLYIRDQDMLFCHDLKEK